MMRLTYYAAGVAAFFAKRSIDDNEYSPGSNAWYEWREGWRSGQRNLNGTYGKMGRARAPE